MSRRLRRLSTRYLTLDVGAMLERVLEAVAEVTGRSGASVRRRTPL
jgi:hypothetical protein